MPVQYTNSKQRTYYLHVGNTKKGNPRYYFAMKSTGNLVDSIPQGYEIYEGPNAHVVLRQIPPKVIFDEEKALVEVGMKKYTDLKYYKLVIRKNTIQVFTPVQDVEMLMEIIEPSKHPILLQALHYSPIMQFVLVDKEKRLFLTKRYCALSSVDDWIEVDEQDSLEKLTQRYLKHIGEDSYYELFPAFYAPGKCLSKDI